MTAALIEPTPQWVVAKQDTDDDGKTATSYWAGGDDWTDYEGAYLYTSKQAAKDDYRDANGRFPRTLDVVQLSDEDEPDDIAEAVEPVEDESAEFCTTSELALLELIEPSEDTTVHDAELVDDDELDRLWDKANRFHADFEAAGRSALVAAWNCGQALIAAKVEVEAIHGYGSWKEWVELSFKGSYRTAAVYAQIAGNVQIAQLAEHDSIAGVLKAIRAAKSGTAKPAPSMEKRAAAILKASRKFAAAVEAFTADIESGRHGNSNIEDYEADMDVAADLMTQAFRAYDIKQWGSSDR